MNFRLFMLRNTAPDDGGAPAPSLANEPTTEPSPEPTPAPSLPEDAPEWLKGVSEEYHANTSLHHVPDVNTLVKNYINAQSMVGKDKIVLPDEHASEEDIEAFYDKLGRPSLEEYKLNFGEGEVYDENFQKGMKEVAYKSGLMPKQAQAMFDYFNSQIDSAVTEDSEAEAAKYQEDVNKLRTDWGSGFDKKMNTAVTAVNTLLDEDMQTYLKDSGLATNPQLIRMFAAIGEQLNEDNFDPNSVKNLGLTKEEADEKINSIMGNNEHPYWNSSHPNHGNAVKDMQKYYDVLNS